MHVTKREFCIQPRFHNELIINISQGYSIYLVTQKHIKQNRKHVCSNGIRFTREFVYGARSGYNHEHFFRNKGMIMINKSKPKKIFCRWAPYPPKPRYIHGCDTTSAYRAQWTTCAKEHVIHTGRMIYMPAWSQDSCIPKEKVWS